MTRRGHGTGGLAGHGPPKRSGDHGWHNSAGRLPTPYGAWLGSSWAGSGASGDVPGGEAGQLTDKWCADDAACVKDWCDGGQTGQGGCGQAVPGSGGEAGDSLM